MSCGQATSVAPAAGSSTAVSGSGRRPGNLGSQTGVCYAEDPRAATHWTSAADRASVKP